MSSSPNRAWLLATSLHAVRGFLIGLAELVPGISGGTVALITGVYEQLLSSASHVIGAARALIRPPDGAPIGPPASGAEPAIPALQGDVEPVMTQAEHASRGTSSTRRLPAVRAELAQVQWSLVVPLVFGMVITVFAAAGTAERLVTSYPEQARGLFFGLVAASLIVPMRLAAERRLHGAAWVLRDVVLVLGAAALTAWLVGFAGGNASADPPYLLVFFAAAVAICALVVPGLSGSLFLLAVGIYSATLTAVSERDLAYIGVFAAGALLGLVSVVQVLRYLLEHHRRVTLLVMTGLMAGSLRALWPWQISRSGGKGTGNLQAPHEPVAEPILLAVLGAAVVLTLIAVEARRERRDAREALTSSPAPRDTTSGAAGPSESRTSGEEGASR